MSSFSGGREGESSRRSASGSRVAYTHRKNGGEYVYNISIKKTDKK